MYFGVQTFLKHHRLPAFYQSGNGPVCRRFRRETLSFVIVTLQFRTSLVIVPLLTVERKGINAGSPPSEDSQPRLNSEAACERRMRGARTRARAEKGPQRAVSRRRFSSKNAAALSEECERAAEIPAPPERCFFRDPQSICIRLSALCMYSTERPRSMVRLDY